MPPCHRGVATPVDGLVVARAGTGLLQGDAERRRDRRVGITERALHLASRAGLRPSDHVSAAAGVSL